MCWKLKIWSYFSRCTDCTQMVHTESTETDCWYAKQAANTPTPDVFWLCLTICHFNVAQDTHLCPTMLVEYYPLYQLPLLPVHIYPFTFNPTCKLPKSCYIFTNVDQHTEKKKWHTAYIYISWCNSVEKDYWSSIIMYTRTIRRTWL